MITAGDSDATRLSGLLGASKVTIEVPADQVARLLDLLGGAKPIDMPRTTVMPPKTADKPLFKPLKVRITTRIDADVLDAFKATGPGWQTLVNQVLRQNMPKKERQAEATA